RRAAAGAARRDPRRVREVPDDPGAQGRDRAPCEGRGVGHGAAAAGGPDRRPGRRADRRARSEEVLDARTVVEGRPQRRRAKRRASMVTRVPWTKVREQLVSVFRAWGMSDAHAETTADMMVETDLRGVDSHGISMLPTYDREFRAGRINMRPQFKAVRQNLATALIDADRSLGHPVSVYAMNLAVDKCRETGVAVVSVVNSHHFGAAGCYSKI